MLRALLNRLRHALRYAQLRQPKARGPVRYDWTTPQKIIGQFARVGLEIRPVRFDPAAHENYVRRANYERFEYYARREPGWFREKTLEHFIAAELLQLRPGEVYIDIANDHAPTPEIYTELYGVAAYRQDLRFPAGLRDRTLGGSADNLPLPAAFVDAMALHCSLEHFEGDVDSGFMREAARTLKPGGRVASLPLYLSEYPAVMTDLAAPAWRADVFDRGSTVHAVNGYGNRHGRFYDAAQFMQRVAEPAKAAGLNLELLFLENYADFGAGIYLNFALVLRKPAGL